MFEMVTGSGFKFPRLANVGLNQRPVTALTKAKREQKFTVRLLTAARSCLNYTIRLDHSIYP